MPIQTDRRGVSGNELLRVVKNPRFYKGIVKISDLSVGKTNPYFGPAIEEQTDGDKRATTS